MTSREDLVIGEVQPAWKSKLFVYTLTVLSTLGGFLFGYDTGVVSGAMLLIKDDFEDVDSLWHELIVSSTVAAALVFSLCGGLCADRYGRRPTILLSGVIFIIGSIIMGVAPNKEVLLAGRLIVGMAIGFESMSVPVYIAECAEPNQRGMLITIYQLLITLGMLFANIIGGIFANVDQGWRYMLGLAAAPALLQFCGFLMMPESPRWLASQKRSKEAKFALFRMRGSAKMAEEELNAMNKNFEEREQMMKEAEARDGGRSLVVRVFSSQKIRRALFVGCALQAFQQLSGINTVMYYSATIIRMSGVSDQSLAIWLSAATAAVNSVCTFIGIYLVERAGRRKLVLCSLLGVMVSLALLGVGFELMHSESPLVTAGGQPDLCASRSSCYDCIDNDECGFCFRQAANGSISEGSCWATNKDGSPVGSGPCLQSQQSASSEIVWANGWCPNKYSWLTILAMAMYLISFSPGLGPMPWTINAEIYPLWARGLCTSISTSFNWLGNLILSSTFLTLMEALSKPGAFYLYLAIATAGLALFWCTLPETVGRSLEELENIFEGKWFDIRGRKTALPALNDTKGASSKGSNNGVEIKIEPVSSEHM